VILDEGVDEPEGVRLTVVDLLSLPLGVADGVTATVPVPVAEPVGVGVVDFDAVDVVDGVYESGPEFEALAPAVREAV
jgi:hypothetical protein